MAQHQPAIHMVQLLMRENLFGFQGNTKSPYIKITVTDPKFINRLRTTVESGNMNYKQMWKGVDGGILTFDSIQYVLRFMIDTGVRWGFPLRYDQADCVLGYGHVMGDSRGGEISYDTQSRSTF